MGRPYSLEKEKSRWKLENPHPFPFPSTFPMIFVTFRGLFGHGYGDDGDNR